MKTNLKNYQLPILEWLMPIIELPLAFFINCILFKASIPKSITTLRGNLAYVGSHFGDSLFIKYDLEEPSIDVLETFSSLSPTIDFTIVDVEQQGQVSTRFAFFA
jgi:hypothetical protein